MPRRGLLDMLGPSSKVLDIISAADAVCGSRPIETLPEDDEAVDKSTGDKEVINVAKHQQI